MHDRSKVNIRQGYALVKSLTHEKIQQVIDDALLCYDSEIEEKAASPKPCRLKRLFVKNEKPGLIGKHRKKNLIAFKDKINKMHVHVALDKLQKKFLDNDSSSRLLKYLEDHLVVVILNIVKPGNLIAAVGHHSESDYELYKDALRYVHNAACMIYEAEGKIRSARHAA